MLLLGFIIEVVSKCSISDYVTTHFFKRLEMNQTYYQVPANQYNHCVANEFNEPQAVLGRPQPIRGVVHDEKAYLLRSCAAGHAGVFSTLNDMSKLGSMLACKGKYNGNPILKATTLDLALVDYNSSLSGKEPDAPKTASHGLGFELNQSWYMGALTNLNCFGHTGYTGTSIIITRDVPSFLIILSNRTHPTRTSGQINKLREQSATVFSNYVNKRLTRY